MMIYYFCYLDAYCPGTINLLSYFVVINQNEIDNVQIVEIVSLNEVYVLPSTINNRQRVNLSVSSKSFFDVA